MSLAPAPAQLRMMLDPMLPHPAVIEEIQPEAYGIATFSLVFTDPAQASTYRFQAGQFNMIYLPGFGEVAISISSNPGTPKMVGHTIRYAGSVTRALGRLKVGDMVGVRGPYGSAWPLGKALGKSLVIVAGGIGLAPLRPALFSILRRREDFGRVVLLCGARTPADILYTEEFERWQAGGIEVHRKGSLPGPGRDHSPRRKPATPLLDDSWQHAIVHYAICRHASTGRPRGPSP